MWLEDVSDEGWQVLAQFSRSVVSKQSLQRTAEIGVQMGRPEWPWAPLKQSALEGKNACCHDIHAQGYDHSGVVTVTASVSKLHCNNPQFFL